MASKMGYYNVEDYLKQRRQQEKIRVPPKANFLAAVNHIRNMFEGKKFTYGVMGGLEMLCLGYRREMPDLQIAYDDRDFHRIKAKLESDQRVRLPEGINSLFPAKVLVRTGPQYKDDSCTQTADVEVDLIPPGSNGTPPNSSLASNLVLVSLKTDGKLRSYKGLNMLYLVKTLVHYCRVRDLAWDPRKDLLFLCQQYGEEVQAIRGYLDQKAVQQNFLGTPFFSRLGPADQHRCYQILLGTEPPPVMAITPPAPGYKHSASNSENITRPRVTCHKSSPSLNMQSSTSLLSPPIGGKRTASSDRAASNQLKPTELPASSNARPYMASPAGQSRDSRSRYRPTSAPVTREGSPNDVPSTTFHMKKTSQPPAQASMLPYKFPLGMNQQRPDFQAQSSSHAAAGIIDRHRPTLTPNLNAGTTRSNASSAITQTSQRNGFTTFPQQSHVFVSPVEMSATPAPSNPSQHHLKSQLGLGGDLAPRQQMAHTIPRTERSTPQARNIPPGHEANRVELSATPAPTQQGRNFHVVNPDMDVLSTSGVAPSAHGHASATGEYIWSSSVQSKRISPPPHQTSHPPPHLPPVELDAMTELGRFIAELSVERNTPAPEPLMHNHPQHNAASTIIQSSNPPPDSPVSPPSPPSKAAHVPIPTNPLVPRHHSAPLAALPASLIAGGLTPHHRSQTHPTQPPQSGEVPSTNLSRYTTYSSHPPPASAQHPSYTSPKQQAAYQAYHPAASHVAPDPDRGDDLYVRDGQGRAGGFEGLKDVDAAGTYFRTHKRDASHDSHTSSQSCDSRELAMEYRAALPGFGRGYGDGGGGGGA